MPEPNVHQEDIKELLYNGANIWQLARKIIERGLPTHGYFIQTNEGEHYYFDNTEKRLLELQSLELRVMLNRDHRINATDRLYNYLLSEMESECAVNGRKSTVAQLAHYDGRTDLLYL